MSRCALVIGGTGFLGTAIAGRLHADGYAVTVLSRGTLPQTTHGVNLLVADREQPGRVKAAAAGKRFDLVVDCVAYKGEDFTDALDAFTRNAGHYVFIGTDFVYALEASERLPIAEEAPLAAASAYAAGKLAIEEGLRVAHDAENFPGTILRPPHLLGAGRPAGCNSVLGRDAELTRRLKRNEPIELIAEGQLIIQPASIRDVAACVAHIAGKPETFGQTFNIAGPDAVTTETYYRLIAKQLGVELTYTSIPLSVFRQKHPQPAPFARHRMYDLSHLKEVTGFEPKVGIEDALRETVDWMEGKRV